MRPSPQFSPASCCGARLPEGLVETLVTEARDAPEREICGLIGLDGDGTLSRYPVGNVAADPGRRFCMDPRGQIAAMRQMRKHGQALYAIYHSHPQGEARPSATDLAEAAYPDALFLIVAPAATGPVLRAFRIADGGATELVVETAPAELSPPASPSAGR